LYIAVLIFYVTRTIKKLNLDTTAVTKLLLRNNNYQHMHVGKAVVLDC